jgi:hypothetical protein
MSFFKVDGELLEAPNSVFSPDYVLLTEHKDEYILPIDGWYWFDTIEEAQTFFNIFPNVTEPSGI